MNVALKQKYPSKSIVSTLFLVFILGIIVSSQYYFDATKTKRSLIPPTIIPAQVIKIGDLGLHSATSALMWIYTIQQASTHPAKVPELIEVTTNLDPKFGYPYAFAALILPPLGFKDEGVNLALKGIQKAGTDWRIPYYLATTYHIFFGDRKNALLYFEIAANTPSAPKEVKIVASRYGTSKDNREQTKEIWNSIYLTSDDEIIKERAIQFITHIEIIELLERAVTIYRQKFGYLPSKIEDLAQPGILKEIPVSPLGVKYLLDPSGRIITGQ